MAEDTKNNTPAEQKEEDIQEVVQEKPIINLYDDKSYKSVVQNLRRFVQAGGKISDPFNQFDNPGRLFFKVFFHFENGDMDSSASRNGSGLLHPTWRYFADKDIYNSHIEGDDINNSSYSPGTEEDGYRVEMDLDLLENLWSFSTAWSYLIQNSETYRASSLRVFVNLLSNICNISPWYFQKLRGIDELTNRKAMLENADMSIPVERQAITIECLDDAVDSRIGTLIDLYRSIVWSHQKKCIILPSNLRKFDMSILLFQMPITGLANDRNVITSPAFGKGHQTGLSRLIGTGSLGAADGWYSEASKFFSEFSTGKTSSHNCSFKLFELHGCEFDFNSSKSGYGDVNNVDGISQPFQLNIFYDDVYEERFNEFLNLSVGDFVPEDSITVSMSDVLQSNINDTGYDRVMNPANADTDERFNDFVSPGYTYSRLSAYDLQGSLDPSRNNMWGSVFQNINGKISDMTSSFIKSASNFMNVNRYANKFTRNVTKNINQKIDKWYGENIAGGLSKLNNWLNGDWGAFKGNGYASTTSFVGEKLFDEGHQKNYVSNDTKISSVGEKLFGEDLNDSNDKNDSKNTRVPLNRNLNRNIFTDNKELKKYKELFSIGEKLFGEEHQNDSDNNRDSKNTTVLLNRNLNRNIFTDNRSPKKDKEITNIFTDNIDRTKV